MAKLNCLNPTPALLRSSVDINGHRRDKIYMFDAKDYQRGRKPDVLIPCRKCKACRLNERNRWIGRITMQAQYSMPNYFITLTYEKTDGKLHYDDVQKFFKRLRKAGYLNFKYFVVGEYGETKRRPHWHILTHGLGITDLKFWKLGTNGGYYLSEEIRKIWGKGHILITTYSDAVAKYVAGYVLKKYDEELIFRVSKGYGMSDDKDLLLETLTRPNGAGLTAYEKQKLRRENEHKYYETADRIRRENKQEIERLWEIAERKRKIDKVFDKIERRLNKGY